MKKLTLLIFALIFSFSAYSQQERFFKANEFHVQGDYDSAVNLYREILASEGPTYPVYFNLGNTYYRQGKLAEAIFVYRKAQEFAPRDADLKFNLNYLRSQALDKVDYEKSWVEGVGGIFSLKEMVVGAVVFGFLFCVLYVLLVLKEKRSLKVVSFATFVLCLFLSGTAIFRSLSGSDFGVVKKNETNVYSGIGRDNVVIFKLNRGTEVIISESTEGPSSEKWSQVHLPDGKKGWMKGTDLVGGL